MKKLVLRCGLSVGDIVMLTAAVRDLHHSYPGEFCTDVRTFYPELWEHNPHLTPLADEDPEVRQLDCSYPLINRSNALPYHCLHGFIEFLNQRLRLAIRLSNSKGDIHLSAVEKSWYSQVHELTHAPIPFWIVAAGGKYDVTIKWWETSRFQQVVDHFLGRIQFVQVGRTGHHHPKLKRVIDLRGQTDLRQLIRLVYHADGVLCPVTGLMHLAAAVPTKRGQRRIRPCVVVAGGREPAHWEAYPGHQFIHVNGALPCCANGGCWKDRSTPLLDGDKRDKPECLCVDLVAGLPRCMDMITPEEVAHRIECYYKGGILKPLTSRQQAAAKRGVAASARNRFDHQPLNIHSAGMACERFVSRIPPYPGGYSGRGIVICGGGVRYFTNVWVCVNMLRLLGCALPVQVWHFGPAEMDKSMAALLSRLGAQSVDAHQGRKPGAPRLTHGWQLKPFAILNCVFREVLLLDADNVPVVDPERLFDSPQFKKAGAIFWPDYSHHPDAKATAIWRSCGLRRPSEPEFESGQIVIDKERSWPALCLSLWFNENASFYYQYLHGDKETFHLAFRKLKQSYALVRQPVHTLPGTMCQHDFEGRRIFQHRNRDKWDFLLSNSRVNGFWFENECRQFILQLRQIWDGRLNLGRSR
jgi:ADP-heptose:LPS heptosyltransferase